MNKNKKYAVTCLNATNVSYKTLVQNNSKIEIHFKYNLVEIAGCVICLPKSLKKLINTKTHIQMIAESL